MWLSFLLQALHRSLAPPHTLYGANICCHPDTLLLHLHGDTAFPCPSCRKVCSVQDINRCPFVHRRMMELSVQCKNGDSRYQCCRWQGKWSDLHQHSRKCKFATVQCVHCNTSLLRYTLVRHVQFECAEACVACARCGLQTKRTALDEHFATDCPETPFR